MKNGVDLPYGDRVHNLIKDLLDIAERYHKQIEEDFDTIEKLEDEKEDLYLYLQDHEWLQTKEVEDESESEIE